MTIVIGWFGKSSARAGAQTAISIAASAAEDIVLMGISSVAAVLPCCHQNVNLTVRRNAAAWEKG
jgi:hypothetical protein